MEYFKAVATIVGTVKSIADIIKSPEFQSTVKEVGDSVKNVVDAAASSASQLESLQNKSNVVVQEISKISADIKKLQELLVRSFEDLKTEIKFEFNNNAVKTQETLIDALYAKTIAYAADFDSFQRSTILGFLIELAKVDVIANTHYAHVFHEDESYFVQVTNRILKAEKNFVSNFETPLQIVLQKFYQSLLLVPIKAFFLETFAYVARLRLGEGNFYHEYAVATNDFTCRMHESIELMNKNLINASRWQWNTEFTSDASVYNSLFVDHVNYSRKSCTQIFLAACVEEVTSNVAENYVISGVRLMKIKCAVHMCWRFPGDFYWRRIFTAPLYYADFFYKKKMSVDEVKFIESKSMTKSHDDDYVLTGVQALHNGDDIYFQATFHKFIRKTGKIIVGVEHEKKLKTDVLITDGDPKVTARIAESNFSTENPILDNRPVFSSTMALCGIALKVSQLNDRQVLFGLQIQTLPAKMDFEAFTEAEVGLT